MPNQNLEPEGTEPGQKDTASGGGPGEDGHVYAHHQGPTTKADWADVVAKDTAQFVPHVIAGEFVDLFAELIDEMEEAEAILNFVTRLHTDGKRILKI